MSDSKGLFKYFDPSKIIFFESRLVLLTPPKYFNDPWDFLPKGRIPTEDEILDVWRETERAIARSSVISVPAHFARREQHERLESMRIHFATREFLSEQSNDYREQMSRVVGVVSLTELPLSRLMWAHYAQSHSGFVAEFDCGDETEESGIRICMCGVGPTPAGKVKYDTEFRQIAKDAANVHELLWSKHRNWEYEREWRIIWPLRESLTCTMPRERTREQRRRFCLPFPPPGLRRVILGMQIKPEAKQRLCRMIEHDDFKHVRKETTAIDPETGELVLKPLESS